MRDLIEATSILAALARALLTLPPDDAAELLRRFRRKLAELARQ